MTILNDNEIKLYFKECHGCQKLYNDCYITRTNERQYVKLCPCLNCIVKSTCTVYCDERSDMFINVIDEKKKLFEEEFNVCR